VKLVWFSCAAQSGNDTLKSLCGDKKIFVGLGFNLARKRLKREGL
jgi:hypothetical protein